MQPLGDLGRDLGRGPAVRPGRVHDDQATRARRLVIREARLGRPPATAQRIDVAPTGKRIGEYLQVKGDEVQCTFCGALIASRSTHWKDVVPRQSLPTSVAGPNRDGGDRFLLCQFYCPSCATVLETEVLLQGEPVENIFAEKQYRLLTEPLYSSWPGPGEGKGPFLVLANVGLFYAAKEPPLVPDVMLSLGVQLGDGLELERWLVGVHHRSAVVPGR